MAGAEDIYRYVTGLEPTQTADQARQEILGTAWPRKA